MNIFSPMHLLVIGVIALLLFGNRLPEVARSMGRAINEFKKGLREVQDDIKDDDQSKSPPRDPPQRLQPPTAKTDNSEPPRERVREAPERREGTDPVNDN